MKEINDFYMEIVKKHNKLLYIIKEYERQEIAIKALTNMNLDELIEAIKSGKVVV